MTTPEEILALAVSAFDRHFTRAADDKHQIPPSDGMWRQETQPGGNVVGQHLSIRRGSEVVKIGRFSPAARGQMDLNVLLYDLSLHPVSPDQRAFGIPFLLDVERYRRAWGRERTEVTRGLLYVSLALSTDELLDRLKKDLARV